jgi:hypothetical protein
MCLHPTVQGRSQRFKPQQVEEVDSITYNNSPLLAHGHDPQVLTLFGSRSKGRVVVAVGQVQVEVAVVEVTQKPLLRFQAMLRLQLGQAGQAQAAGQAMLVVSQDSRVMLLLAETAGQAELKETPG